MKKIYASVALVALCSSAFAQEESDPSISDMDFLIGEWEGQSTFLYPREEERAQMHESVAARCDYILNDSYIQCDMSMTRPDERVRNLRLHFNYNRLDEDYQVLFIYDRWPRNVSYLLHFDAERNVYTGFSDFETSDGIAGQERIEWSVSDDGREVSSVEFNHMETEAKDYWSQYFDFVWRKVEQE
jgi:hypothetical protein